MHHKLAEFVSGNELVLICVHSLEELEEALERQSLPGRDLAESLNVVVKASDLPLQGGVHLPKNVPGGFEDVAGLEDEEGKGIMIKDRDVLVDRDVLGQCARGSKITGTTNSHEGVFGKYTQTPLLHVPCQ